MRAERIRPSGPGVSRLFRRSIRAFLPISQDRIQDRMMSRQDANAAFARSSFLYGSNAPYIEDLYARYEADPKSVDAEWQSFFASLKDDPREVSENARGPSSRRHDWPQRERNDWVAGLDA